MLPTDVRIIDNVGTTSQPPQLVIFGFGKLCDGMVTGGSGRWYVLNPGEDDSSLCWLAGGVVCLILIARPEPGPGPLQDLFY